MIGVRCGRDRELRMRTCVVDLGEPALVNGNSVDNSIFRVSRISPGPDGTPHTDTRGGRHDTSRCDLWCHLNSHQ